MIEAKQLGQALKNNVKQLTILVITVAGAILVFAYLHSLPHIDDVKTVAKNQTTHVYAADGSLIASLFTENRTIVPLSQISPHLQDAILSMEDKRFYEHSGLDPVRIAGAFIQDTKSFEAVQGGSTITQQYVRTAYLSNKKSIIRKLDEALLSIQLEQTHTKRQIFEMYLNTIYLGNGAYGTEAAAQTYFGVPASKLNLEQSALLASQISSPEHYDPYRHPKEAITQRNLVLDLMLEQGSASPDEVGAAKSHPLRMLPKRQNHNEFAPYFVEWVKTELKKAGFTDKEIYSHGFEMYTTLDPRMQRAAEKAWQKYLPYRSQPDVALVAVEPASGAVKAMVGGKDFDKQKLNLAVAAKRPPASAFKPVVLTTALMNGISPDFIYDASAPQTFKVRGSNWIVQNVERTPSEMSLREATAYSINVVYARLGLSLGVQNVIAVAKKLGIRSRLHDDPWVVIGGTREGVTPLEMASVYATFANDGKHNTPFGITRLTSPTGEILYEHKNQPKQVIDHAVAYLVTDLLRDVVRQGTGKRTKIGRPAAGKTGTNTKYSDAWFCGYTPDLAAVVWVGYKDKQRTMVVRRIKVLGGTFPAQMWSAFMKEALKDKKPRDFNPPPRDSLIRVLMNPRTKELTTKDSPEARYCVFVRKYVPKALVRYGEYTTVQDATYADDSAGLSQGSGLGTYLEAADTYKDIYKTGDGDELLNRMYRQRQDIGHPPSGVSAISSGVIENEDILEAPDVIYESRFLDKK